MLGVGGIGAYNKHCSNQKKEITKKKHLYYEEKKKLFSEVEKFNPTVQEKAAKRS